MANVITYGTFDLFHVGHLRLLQRARSVVRKELLYHGVPIVFQGNRKEQSHLLCASAYIPKTHESQAWDSNQFRATKNQRRLDTRRQRSLTLPKAAIKLSAYSASLRLCVKNTEPWSYQ